MTTSARIRALEHRFKPKSWIDEMTDGELEAALAAVTVNIARGAHTTPEDLADHLRQQVDAGEIVGADRHFAERFVNFVCQPEDERAKAEPDIGTLFRAAALSLRLDGLANPDDFPMTDDPMADLMAHIARNGQRSIVDKEKRH